MIALCPAIDWQGRAGTGQSFHKHGHRMKPYDKAASATTTAPTCRLVHPAHLIGRKYTEKTSKKGGYVCCLFGEVSPDFWGGRDPIFGCCPFWGFTDYLLRIESQRVIEPFPECLSSARMRSQWASSFDLPGGSLPADQQKSLWANGGFFVLEEEVCSVLSRLERDRKMFYPLCP